MFLHGIALLTCDIVMVEKKENTDGPRESASSVGFFYTGGVAYAKETKTTMQFPRLPQADGRTVLRGAQETCKPAVRSVQP